MPTFATYFALLPDPRYRRARKHPLLSVLILAICATLAGADSFTAIVRWSQANHSWLVDHGVDLPHGIPSRDTFCRLFARLDVVSFHTCFVNWTQALRQPLEGEIIALDGKTLRHSFDTATGQKALHLVSVWASGNRLTLAQQVVESHENEIVAIPALLNLLALKGCLVTMDAMGTHKHIVEQIVDKKGDYVLTLKANHRSLYERTEEFFTHWCNHHWKTPEGKPLVHQYAQTTNSGHGRTEVRRCWLVSADWLDTDKAWKGLKSVAAVECERRVGKGEKQVVTRQVRYFLSSVAGDKAAQTVLRASRLHWGIENRLHWVLDVVMGEDGSRVRKQNEAKNLALVRKIALNLLRQDKTPDLGGIKGKRQVAGWDIGYLEAILLGKPYALPSKKLENTD